MVSRQGHPETSCVAMVAIAFCRPLLVYCLYCAGRHQRPPIVSLSELDAETVRPRIHSWPGVLSELHAILAKDPSSVSRYFARVDPSRSADPLP